MLNNTLAFVFITLILGACAASPERQARMDLAESSMPICTGEADCRVKWEAAQIWVVEHSRYRMQIVTDVLLETYGSVDYSPDLAFRVVKQPLGEGRYIIIMTAGCANIFGCQPDHIEAKINFNRYIASVTQ